ncbi:MULTISPECIES: hypothetical protein [Methylosinus]|uniref:DUF4148 domain-containing protein n=1 Tax=Methylosinus trichosporium (strain ATCC 35070 / NCIMB 11131 / UNIQEM 75 / OB3b) TaxID=595536 RepID=A0A2D2D025_METT3|nr:MULTISPECIES: hypothetical protein [Methylosinus]ATQ68340.1 hypothetical protein CQW49_10950 [Methylosinus trichosporium OB3b]OBS50922.1 hypothetical protein A8B73_18710 [Methylosinus sp. 3S-1]
MRRIFALAPIALLLAAPTRAEDASSSVGATIGRFFEGVGLRNAPPPRVDFVERSRPADLDYTPLGPKVTRPDLKTVRAEADAMQKELEAAAAAARARAARVKTPDAPTKSRDGAARRP